MLSIFCKEKTGEALKQQAKSLGVSSDELGSNNGMISDPILQQRVREARNTRFAQLTWLLALASAVASIFSAIAAWVAIGRIR